MAHADFKLKTPCADCPFRSDKQFHLTKERAKQFADNLRGGGQFHCHKTVDWVEDAEDGMTTQQPKADGKTQWCAGALITMEKSGGCDSNQYVRIAERMGAFDPSVLDMAAPVYGSLSEWVRSYGDPVPTVTVEFNGIVEVLEYEHCGVVGPDCEDPAGYMGYAGATESDEEPTCDPTRGCGYCGSPMCGACSSNQEDEYGNPLCVGCAEEPEED